MPIYSYSCESCGYNFEELQRMNDEPCKICPKCKKPQLKKIIGKSNVIFKGNGWTPKHYNTGSNFPV